MYSSLLVLFIFKKEEMITVFTIIFIWFFWTPVFTYKMKKTISIFIQQNYYWRHYVLSLLAFKLKSKTSFLNEHWLLVYRMAEPWSKHHSPSFSMEVIVCISLHIFISIIYKFKFIYWVLRIKGLRLKFSRQEMKSTRG